MAKGSFQLPDKLGKENRYLVTFETPHLNLPGGFQEGS